MPKRQRETLLLAAGLILEVEEQKTNRFYVAREANRHEWQSCIRFTFAVIALQTYALLDPMFS